MPKVIINNAGIKTEKWIGTFGVAILSNNTVATTEIVVASWAILANSFAALDNLDLILSGQVSGTGTLTFRIRFGPAGTIGDALLCTFVTSAPGTANAYHFLNALISFLTTTTAIANGQSLTGNGVVGLPASPFLAATVNLSVANFLSVTLAQTITQTYTSRAAKLSV